MISVWVPKYLDTSIPPRLQIKRLHQVDLLSSLGELASSSLLRIQWDFSDGYGKRWLDVPRLNVEIIEFKNIGSETLNLKQRTADPIRLEVPSGSRIILCRRVPDRDSRTDLRVGRKWDRDRHGFKLLPDQPDFLGAGDFFRLIILHNAPSLGDLRLTGRLFGHPPLAIVSSETENRLTRHERLQRLALRSGGYTFAAFVTLLVWRRTKHLGGPTKVVSTSAAFLLVIGIVESVVFFEKQSLDFASANSIAYGVVMPFAVLISMGGILTWKAPRIAQSIRSRVSRRGRQPVS